MTEDNNPDNKGKLYKFKQAMRLALLTFSEDVIRIAFNALTEYVLEELEGQVERLAIIYVTLSELHAELTPEQRNRLRRAWRKVTAQIDLNSPGTRLQAEKKYEEIREAVPELTPLEEL